MKASGYNPKAEFFLALGTFNKVVADQELLAIKDTKLKQADRGVTVMPENGQPYGGAEFWSLYAGLIEPPETFAQKHGELTQEDVDEWVRVMRDNFRLISLKHMCTRGEARALLKQDEFDLVGDHLPDDDLSFIQEVLAGLVDPTVDEAIRRAKRSESSQPVQEAMAALLENVAQKTSLSV